MTDQQMHERLEVAGARWRSDEAPAAVRDVKPSPPQRNRIGGRHLTWLLTAAAFLAAAVGIAVALLAGGGNSQPPAGELNDLYGVRWTSYGAEVGYIGYTPAPSSFRLSNRPWLRFDRNGTVIGNDGCNALTGPITVRGDTMDFGRVAVTSKACAGPAGKIASGIDRILFGDTTWRIVCNTLAFRSHAGELDFAVSHRTAADVACFREWSNAHAVK